MPVASSLQLKKSTSPFDTNYQTYQRSVFIKQPILYLSCRMNFIMVRWGGAGAAWAVRVPMLSSSFLFVNFNWIELKLQKLFVSNSSWVSSLTNCYQIEHMQVRLDSSSDLGGIDTISVVTQLKPFFNYWAYMLQDGTILPHFSPY